MITRRSFLLAAATSGLSGFAGRRLRRSTAADRPAERFFHGPLRVCRDNPRYFCDSRGKAIYLCGSHVWNNLVDMGPSDPPPAFDFAGYLDFLQRYGHNFIRLWRWEHVVWDTRANGRWGKEVPHRVAPHPWARTGPGQALDGKPKFDLQRFDPEYFKRLRQRVEQAAQRGIYVSVMLFEGWAMQRMSDAWRSHPFHPENNINNVDGDQNGDGKGLEIHTLANPRITAIQETYVRKVIETVGDLDNVLFEISNENHPPSTAWQYHMIRFVKQLEAGRAKQHPVGMTFQFRGGSNKTLFDSPADWISPNPNGGYRENPPPNDGRKVILLDTDHLWGIGGNASWVWKAFTRGHNPLFMDPYDGVVLGKPFDPTWEPIRRSLGYTRQLAARMDLTSMQPHGDLASSKYCLADPGKEYVVYLPSPGKCVVDLSHVRGERHAVWIDPRSGQKREAGTWGPGKHQFTPPTQADAVLWIRP